MNIYLLPICDLDSVWIESVKAKSMEDAKNRIMKNISTEYDLDVPTDWEDFMEIANKESLYIGDIQDLEEF